MNEAHELAAIKPNDAPASPWEDIRPEQLLRANPEAERWRARWQDYQLAYRGGFEFLAAAGQDTNFGRLSGQAAQVVALPGIDTRHFRRFLWQLEGEPNAKYLNRWERASYVNYLGAIIDFFRHWLYSQPPQIRPVDEKDPPEWWNDFYENANGGGQSLIDVARESFLDVLLCRRAGWLIGKDEEFRVVLSPYSANEIVDWQQNAVGELEWVVLAKCRDVRQFPDQRRKVEVITYVNRDEWQSWEIKDVNGEKKSEYLGGFSHGLGVVPFVMREIPPGLWVADKLFAPCMSLFNRMNMLEYSEHLGCYLQPFMRTHEGRQAESRILGDGIILNLRAADGDRAQEEFGWIAPDTGPTQHLADRLRQDRDEIYRTVHQMSLAVDSQAVGAIARSGASKIEDRRATEVILAGFGRYELRALVQTANIISKVQGDNTEWVGDGFENFQTSTLDEELQIAALVQTMGIKSPTFNAEVDKMIATGRVLPHLGEKLKGKIEGEIDKAAKEAQAERDAMKVQGVEVMGEDGKPQEGEDGSHGDEPFAPGRDGPPQAKGKPPFAKKPFPPKKPAEAA